MKLIILDAGDAFELDGFNKLLIRHPKEKKTIVELYKDLFEVEKIEIVVGYKAIEIMNHYPEFDYIYNKKWQVTASGYSLSLALDDEPCYVVPSDYIVDKETIELMSEFENCALIKQTENRRQRSLNVNLTNDEKINKVYKGSSRNNDPELLGIFKISDKKLLREWKKNCVLNSQGYAGENLPLLEGKEINCIHASDDTIEINTPEDYIGFLRRINQ